MTNAKIRRRARTVSSQDIVGDGSPPRPNGLDNRLELAICYVDPDSLKPPARLLRKNGSRQSNAIAASIRAFGFLNPILVDDKSQVVCGHARWLAAKDLGLNEVPVICAAHLSPEQLRLYALAENRCGELGEWDRSALKMEFAELAPLTFDCNFNLELSGFTTAEIDLALADDPDGAEGEPADLALDPMATPVSRHGDLWRLGQHRLLCGNALAEESYAALMGEGRAQMIFCDAPYNLPARTISRAGKGGPGDFAMASGEMTRAEFTAFLGKAFKLMARFSIDGSIHFQCMDWKHQREMLDAGYEAYTELKNLVVWDKGTGGQGACYRSQHELIYVWKNGTSRHINNFGLGETGRYRTNVWAYRGNNSFHRDRLKQLATHATVKPLALVADAIRDCSHRGAVILDAFGGSGTTLLAAEHTGRQARLIELEPRFCDATVRAWQERTGREAILDATGQTWADVAAIRGVDVPARNGVGEWPSWRDQPSWHGVW